MLDVRAVNTSWSRWDSSWIRVRSAADNVGGSDTFDTILILVGRSWFATLSVYHLADRPSIQRLMRPRNAARSIGFFAIERRA